MSWPPIYLAAQGSQAILAAQTLAPDFQIQLDPQNTTVNHELDRLVRAGMSMLASSGQLAAMGFWSLEQGVSEPLPLGFCQNIAIQSATEITILVMPYIILLGISLFLVTVSYAECFGARRIRYWRKYAEPWALYRVGELHRDVAQYLYDGIKQGRADAGWPRLESECLGFNVVDENGLRRFGPVASAGS
jgi:hypothetical protein